MAIYGITGQTGAGKSTVLDRLATLGAVVIDCDKVYWEILGQNKQLQQELMTVFGDISDETGGIERKKLGNVVFSSTDSLSMLNEITHPYVLEKVEEKIKKAQEEKENAVVVIDAISLIESGLHHRCDYVFAVTAKAETRISRIMARDSISFDYASSRVQAQKSESFYRENANAVIENDFLHIEEFKQYVDDFFIKYN